MQATEETYITLYYNVEAFVWLDETGTDRRDQLRKYGYALRGVTPVYHRILVRGDMSDTMQLLQYHPLRYWHWRKKRDYEW